MEWISLGWRDGILLLVAVAAVYLVFMLLKLTRLGRQVKPGNTGVVRDEIQEPMVAKDSQPLWQAKAAKPQDSLGDWPENAHDAISMSARQSTSPVQADTEWEEMGALLEATEQTEASPSTGTAASRRTGGFGEHLAEHLARTDMEMEVQRMRNEMERMRSEMEELRAARRVSPQYAEAMEMAQRGMSAQELADRLGISLGEAELVHALSRSDQHFDEGEDHGAEQYATGTDGFDETNRLRQSSG